MTEESTDNKLTENKWYVIRVQSGREEQVRDGLLRRVNAAGIVEKITNVIVPTEKVTEIRGGRKSVREKKWSEAAAAHPEVQQHLRGLHTWFMVRETPGIGDFLGLKEPIPMAEHEVQKMMTDQSESDEERPKIKIDFTVGESVRIKEGAYENFDGVVEEILPQKGLVRGSVVVFGRPTPVEVEYWQIEKV